MTEQRYGRHPNKKEVYPVADWIYGHRLIINQHWMEYLLEFLNVFVGYDCKLGRGIDMGINPPIADAEGYKVISRFGLRRFVFYDDRNKVGDVRDRKALEELEKALKAGVITQGTSLGNYSNLSGQSGRGLETVRSLLRNFTAIRESRSWYACSLIPVHKNFLFFEARRPSLPKSAPEIDLSKIKDLDQGISQTDRNFYARGGEIYYLMLSAGTENDPVKRDFIGKRLDDLLSQNEDLGQLAEIIDTQWTNYKANQSQGKDSKPTKIDLGWIANQDCPAYQLAAEDLACFLQSAMDQSAAIELLAHLIGFHMVQMIYWRTNETLGNSGLPLIPVDCSSSPNRRAFHHLSASQLKANQEAQIQAVYAYTKQLIQEWFPKAKGRAENSFDSSGGHVLDELNENLWKHFNITQLQKDSKGEYEALIKQLRTSAQSATLGSSDSESDQRMIEEISTNLAKYFLSRYRKSFLGVHRKIGQGIGLIRPRFGRGQRYILSPVLQKALVIANVEPKGTGQGRLFFDDFVARLYERYGLVIGPVEARKAALFELRDIDHQYYKDNLREFRKQLKNAGLLSEYSDATAVVINHYPLIVSKYTVLAQG